MPTIGKGIGQGLEMRSDPYGVRLVLELSLEGSQGSYKEKGRKVYISRIGDQLSKDNEMGNGFCCEEKQDGHFGWTSGAVKSAWSQVVKGFQS